ncbi:MAG: hypothetical protein IPF70_15760 [Saprospiraceae bacterium]|nr:hypothetical protein [Saprospiraceae bacterium]
MKILKQLLFLIFIALINSCASNAKFPISNVVPAAVISAKKKIDSQNNFNIEITAQNLASADRLDPAGNNYSIWISTKDHGVKNIGQLNVENAKKLHLKQLHLLILMKFLSPLKIKEIWNILKESK